VGKPVLLLPPWALQQGASSWLQLPWPQAYSAGDRGPALREDRVRSAVADRGVAGTPQPLTTEAAAAPRWSSPNAPTRLVGPFAWRPVRNTKNGQKSYVKQPLLTKREP
jgi:hypothetical protein